MDNREIIETYYRLHQAELLTFVCSRLDNRDLAEDIVQDVFLRLLCTPQPIMECTLSALTLTIARHLINDYYRRRNCRITFTQQLSTNPATSEKEAESVLSIREVTEFLERGLARIAEPCRDIYRLHIYEGMKVSDIAHHLNSDYKSTEYRLGIARKEVRKYLKRIS
jgi:RNA polymerase sigma-70 factor (ECF subfamily)